MAPQKMRKAVRAAQEMPRPGTMVSARCVMTGVRKISSKLSVPAWTKSKAMPLNMMVSPIRVVRNALRPAPLGVIWLGFQYFFSNQNEINR